MDQGEQRVTAVPRAQLPRNFVPADVVFWLPEVAQPLAMAGGAIWYYRAGTWG